MVFKLVPSYKKNSIVRNQDIFEDFFDNFFNDDFFAPLRKIETQMTTGFRVDVQDNGDYYLIEADLPGFDKENVKIEYENNYLTITAKKESSDEVNESNYIRKERKSGEYRRSFYIDNVVTENVNASFKDGVLEINLQKKPINSDIKEIEIK